jgi:hypothetical protein
MIRFNGWGPGAYEDFLLVPGPVRFSFGLGLPSAPAEAPLSYRRRRACHLTPGNPLRRVAGIPPAGNRKMANRKAKLATLLQIEGYASPIAFAEAFVTDSVCPAICMADDCDHTTELEPDQDQGYCGECHTNTMTSGLLLMGLV